MEAGQASVDGHVATVGGWAALVAAMIVAGGLWWLYFDSAVEINLRVLELSGGSPTMARAIFAVGHQAAGVRAADHRRGDRLLLEEDPPAIAAKLACFGIAIYLAGTRSFLHLRGRRRATLIRVLVLVATFALWRLEEPLGPHGYMWLLAVWVVGCAAITTRLGREAERRARALFSRRRADA